MKVPQNLQDLLLDDKKAYAVLATVSRGGAPQATLVWFNMDGEILQINSARGRVKDRNMRRHPFVAVVIIDPDDPARYLQVRGKVIEITEQNAEDHIHTLSLKYTGHRYSIPPAEKRIRYRILPTAFTGSN